MSTIKLQGQIALVTGATRGIGACIAHTLASRGFHVIGTATTTEGAQKISQALSAFVGCKGVTLNVNDAEGLQALIDSIVIEQGALHVLVNNAGVALRVNGKKSLVVDTLLEDWQRTLDINLTGTFLVSKHAIPLMQRHKWGRIINMSSRAARTRTILAGSHYAASKAAILGFSRILADEVAAYGITVNCIAPTRISTPMAASVSNPAEIDAKFIAETPVGRMGVPKDVSAVVSFLASEEASFLTGITVDISGGQFMP
jgi:3-oxoacyl-[acyl-carrier protein] reductase